MCSPSTVLLCPLTQSAQAARAPLNTPSGSVAPGSCPRHQKQLLLTPQAELTCHPASANCNRAHTRRAPGTVPPSAPPAAYSPPCVPHTGRALRAGRALRWLRAHRARLPLWQRHGACRVDHLRRMPQVNGRCCPVCGVVRCLRAARCALGRSRCVLQLGSPSHSAVPVLCCLPAARCALCGAQGVCCS